MNQALWQQLKQHGLVKGEEPTEDMSSTPWYVRTMLAIAGWFGAMFLLGAVFSVIGLLIESALTAGIVGGVACLVAVLIYRLPDHNDFLAQFAFAVSLAGQSLLIFSILSELGAFDGRDPLIDHLRILSMVTLCLQALLFFIVPNYLHRIWSSLLFVASLMFLMNYYGLYPFTQSLLFAAGIALWLQEFNWAKLGSKLAAPAYALIFVSLILLCVDTYLWAQSIFWLEVFGITTPGDIRAEHLSSILMSSVLLGLVLTLLMRAEASVFSGASIAAILLAVLVAYIGLFIQGITVGTVLVILGFAHSNRVLKGLGLVVLLVFVCQFYYLLDLTLLVKSALLIVSGLLLLAIRYLMGYIWPAGVPENA